MSKEVAADLFEQVIRSVIEESRQDFEDCGVDEGTLIELGEIWREKLQQQQRQKQHVNDTKEGQEDNGNGGGGSYNKVKKESLDGEEGARPRGDKDDEEIHESDDEDDDFGEEDDEDDEDDEGDIILCLYERVQRVRNRWKCQLREGLATFNGRDYTFSKASGDSEW